MTVQDAPCHDADDCLIRIEGMTAKRPQAKHQAERRDDDHHGNEDAAS